ncbi:uncharacterized protein METZ01_LOCUS73248 [marine metagenome]|uniref:Uncharacterized protein n=1 Tax=marine metagenome TaxID=408172 RepID=A0A381TX75_9ZZZZ
MGAKTYGWLIFTWMVMMFLDAIGSGTTNAEYSSNANIALSLNVLKMYNIGFISIPLPNVGWFSAVYALASWQFWYFDNTFGTMMRLFVGIPVMGILMYGLITSVMPVIISGASAVLTFISNSLSGLSSFFRIGG